MEALVETRGLDVVLGGARVLHDVNFAIRSGEVVTVVGPNGSGKSTLLRALVGALAPSAGAVIRRPGLVFGYVPQKLAIDHTLPITLTRFLALSGASESDRRAAMARVGVERLGDRQLIDLSGGQFQRAMLAQAILRRPDLLVLDEAAQGLDQPGVADFYRLIEEVRGALGCAVLMVSHDLHVVMAASDRVVCLNGHICCEGAPTAVSEAPEYRALFGFGTGGTLALYRHEHDHSHGTGHDHGHAGHHRHGGANAGGRTDAPQ